MPYIIFFILFERDIQGLVKNYLRKTKDSVSFSQKCIDRNNMKNVWNLIEERKRLLIVSLR
jgi:hypothetical protein